MKFRKKLTTDEQVPEANAPELTANEQNPKTTALETTGTENENHDVENTEWVSAGETLFKSERGDYFLSVEKLTENLWGWATFYKKKESINPRRSNNMASSLKLAKKFAEQSFELHRIKNS